MLLSTVILLLLIPTACITSGIKNPGQIETMQEEMPIQSKKDLPVVEPLPEEKVPSEAKAVKELKKIFVAVSNFQINTTEEELQGLARDIPQTLTEAFLKNRYLKPVERQEFERLFDEYKLSLQGLTDDETAVEVGKVLGAEYILLGSMIKVGASVKMNCRLVRTATSEIVFTDSVRGSYENLFDLEEELTLKVENFIFTLEAEL